MKHSRQMSLALAFSCNHLWNYGRVSWNRGPFDFYCRRCGAASPLKLRQVIRYLKHVLARVEE